MNQFQKFARLSPGARAKGRTIEIPPLGRPATSFDNAQILTHGAGRGVPTKLGKLGFHASIPGRVDFVRGQASGGLPRHLDLPVQLGRGFIAPATFSIFRVKQGCSPAERNRSRNHSLSQGADQLSHFKDLNFVGHQPTKRGIHRVGTFTQGLGND